jgi:hypothetical protein
MIVNCNSMNELRVVMVHNGESKERKILICISTVVIRTCYIRRNVIKNEESRRRPSNCELKKCTIGINTNMFLQTPN